MRHTVGVHQSVILTRELYYAAFCQGAIMSFYSTRCRAAKWSAARLHAAFHHPTVMYTIECFGIWIVIKGVYGQTMLVLYLYAEFKFK